MGKIKRVIISILIANLVVASAYFFLFAEVWSKNKKIASIESEIAGQNEKDVKLQFIGKLLEETKEKRELVSKTFLNSDGAVSFIEEMERLAKNNNVSINIDSITIDKNFSNNKEKINLRIKADGSWKNLYKFFGLLESLSYNIDISRISWSKDSKISSLGSPKNSSEIKSSESWNMGIDFSVLKQK